MQKRAAIIPGIDPEVEIHGKMPELVEQLEQAGISCADVRDDREKFGDLANPLIDTYPDRLNMPWWRFNSVACSVPDAIVSNRMIFHKDLPVVGINNLRWEMAHAEQAQRDELKVPEPEVHFKGRTGLLAGRSSFNYYHFINDVLVFLEDIYDLVDKLGLDRILINPCIDGPTGFQRQLIDAIYPDLSDRIVMDASVFRADHLTFVNVWPTYFSPPDGEEALKRSGPKGISRRAFRASAIPFFERASRMIGDTGNGPDVVVISRKDADRRKVLNEDAMLDALSSYSVEAVAMEKLSVREQMALCAGAKVVIGPHGAGMTNAGFCRPGATAIELTARHYLLRGTDFASLAMIRYMNYHFAITDEEGDIEQMKGNVGNEIRLGQPALDHIVEVVDAALAAPTKA